MYPGWWLRHPSDKHEFVKWDDEIPHRKIKNKSKPATSIIFVRSWQVDILQVQNQSSAFTGPIDTTSGACGNATELAKLLQNVLVELGSS